MSGFKLLFVKPLTHISFRCEVPTPSVVEGPQHIIFKPHILKRHIPELPTRLCSSIMDVGRRPFFDARPAKPARGPILIEAPDTERLGRGNTVEVVLFEISNSMKPYPSVFHAYLNKLRPAKAFFQPTSLDEASRRIPPTSQIWRLLFRLQPR